MGFGQNMGFVNVPFWVPCTLRLVPFALNIAAVRVYEMASSITAANFQLTMVREQVNYAGRADGTGFALNDLGTRSPKAGVV